MDNTITIDKVGGNETSKHAEIFGTSQSVKPTNIDNPKLRVNDLFIELDTGDAYFWNGLDWQIVGG
jgi:hypothetical protein